jgi:hypothetical protein
MVLVPGTEDAMRESNRWTVRRIQSSKKAAWGPRLDLGAGQRDGLQARLQQSVSGCARLARGKSNSGIEVDTDGHSLIVNTIVITRT